jgi:dTDP-4-amino-4,6-dideoxygalactose transaminase
VAPRSRQRFYGRPWNYFRFAGDLLRGTIRRGDDISRLERRLADFIEVDHAVCVPQNRVGTYLTLSSLLKPGQSVVLSPYTIYDVVNMVICAGGTPVFADIDRQTCNIDPAEVEKLIDESTGAVLATHLHGLAAEIERLREICDERGVPLIEDTAQAFGARVNGRQVGTFGRAGVLSFGMAKNVNSLYGGLVATDDSDLAGQIRERLASFPYKENSGLLSRAAFAAAGDLVTARGIFDLFTYWIFRFGYLHDIDTINRRVRGEDAPVVRRNIPEEYLRRFTPSQARIAEAQLDRLEADTAIRVEHARLYDQGLSDLPDVIRPPFRDDGSHIYLVYPLQVPDRHRLLRHLQKHCRDLTVQHMGNCAEYECFREYGRACPNAAATASQVLLLPTYPGYGLAEAERNVLLIRRYFGRD